MKRETTFCKEPDIFYLGFRGVYEYRCLQETELAPKNIRIANLCCKVNNRLKILISNQLHRPMPFRMARTLHKSIVQKETGEGGTGTYDGS